MTLGAKVDYSEITGHEVLPNVRGLWHVSDEHTVWGALSRAVQLPGRFARDTSILTFMYPAFPLPFSQTIFPLGDAAEPETLVSWELGYRGQLSTSLFLDTTAFYYDYEDLRYTAASFPYVTTDPIDRNVIPLIYVNDRSGHAVGAELYLNWQWIGKGEMGFIYSYLDWELRDSGEKSVDAEEMENEQARHKMAFNAEYWLNPSWRLNWITRYTSAIEVRKSGVSGVAEIDSVLRTDLNITWVSSDSLQLSFGGKNIFDPMTKEGFDAEHIEISKEILREFTVGVQFDF